MDIKEILRNNGGLIGDTTRTLTEYYFNFLHNPNDLRESCRALLEYRNDFYKSIPEANGLTENEIKLLSNSFYDNLPPLMLIFYFIECYVDEKFQDLIDATMDIAYVVAMEEHQTTSQIKSQQPLIKEMSEAQVLYLEKIISTRY